MKLNGSKKVCFVLFQTGNRANGGISSIMEIITSLQNVEPVVITQLESKAVKKLRDKDIETYVIKERFSGTSKISRLMNIMFFNVAVWQLLVKRSICVVHANDIRALTFSIGATKMKRASLVFNIRDVMEPHRNYTEHWHLVKYCDKILVLSHSMKAALDKRLPLDKAHDKELIQPIYSIVDFDKFKKADNTTRKALRKKMGFSDDTFVILYAATFNDKKNQLNFIEKSLPSLTKALPEVRICFVGDFKPKRDVYARKCLNAVKENKLEKWVQFEGYSNKIANWYQLADVTVLASRREGLARCMIESLACGTPVVSFDVASAHEILENYNCGKVVPQGDYKQLVKELIVVKESVSERCLMGENGIKMTRNLFQASEIVKQYEQEYLATV